MMLSCVRIGVMEDLDEERAKETWEIVREFYMTVNAVINITSIIIGNDAYESEMPRASKKLLDFPKRLNKLYKRMVDRGLDGVVKGKTSRIVEAEELD
jgi:hypothetical protein